MPTMYFAYGSNMDAEQMAYRCPGAVCSGPATLTGYRFIINQRGYATIHPDASSETPGLLWQITPADEAKLDRYEGYFNGLYDKCFRTVWDTDGREVSAALVYIDHRNQCIGVPREGYLERILAGGRKHGLPEPYLAYLVMWPRKAPEKAFNRLINRIKSGKDVADAVIKYKGDVASWLKRKREKLMIRALDALLGGEGSTGFEAELEKVMLVEAEKFAREQDDVARAKDELESLGASRFKAHMAYLREGERFLDALNSGKGPSEVAGAGVIITDDPKRAHGAGDRFIVTPHARVLSELMHRVSRGTEDFSWHACALIPDLADAVVQMRKNSTNEDVVRGAFATVYAATIEKF